MACCINLVCCMTIWIMTLAICLINLIFCALVAGLVRSTNDGAGIAFLVIFVFCNVVCILRSICPSDELKINCWASCSSVMVLLAVSFTLITRYHYYERSPRYPDEQFSALLVHKFGLICLVAGIPVMYGCKCRYLINDKKMIYKVIVDFIDIYEMAEVLALGAPSCTLLHSNINLYNNPVTNFNNTFYNSTIASFNNTAFNNTFASKQYDKTPDQFNCTDSTYSALREGSWMENTVQVVCSFSFLIFFIIYREAMKESEEKNDSLKKYVRITRLLQDIPFLVIRTLVWIMYGFEDQFIFLVKNAVSASLISLELCESCHSPDAEQDMELGEQRNKRQQSHTNLGFNPK